MGMTIITTTADLAAACKRFARFDSITVDTEFMRETTYWPKLCVIQVASPDEAVMIDAMAPDIELDPFFKLMKNEKIMKVFHAARQDIEIVFHLGGLIPHPVFDTQVAAMVCGFGDSISYDQLVQRLTGEKIDKSSRFTDWSRRPLSERQTEYALADVTHLREVYAALALRLAEQNRTEWVREEMEVLTSPDTYQMEPELAWKRLKLRVR
jgi:ribonuclease D